MDYYLSKLPGKLSLFLHTNIYFVNLIGIGKYAGPRHFQIFKAVYDTTTTRFILTHTIFVSVHRHYPYSAYQLSC